MPDGGEILLDGENIAGLDRKQLKRYRHLVQMVFQDPFASLNPRHRVGDIIALGPILRGTPRGEAWDRARELLGPGGAAAGRREPLSRTSSPAASASASASPAHWRWSRS